MQKILPFFLLILVLVACNSSANGVPTLMPAADATTESGEGSPRVTETPEPGLPATWTPQPTTEGSVLGTVEQQIEGTRFIYVVRSGDSLSKIAARYGVDVSDLARINNIRNWDLIEVGQELIIPIRGE